MLYCRAMKLGHWILLDELNLANQSVLEGLNACLDHRGEVYIPELDKTFRLERNSAESVKIFATQNPYKDGSGRKGLPRSFLNRFVKVFVSPLNTKDEFEICKFRFPDIRDEFLISGVEIVDEINRVFGGKTNFEFNLRDLMKFCSSVESGNSKWNLKICQLIFKSRFRNCKDKQEIDKILHKKFPVKNEFSFNEVPPENLTRGNSHQGEIAINEVSSQRGVSINDVSSSQGGFSINEGSSYTREFRITEEKLKIGLAELDRKSASPLNSNSNEDQQVLLSEQFELLENLMISVKFRWIPLIVGFEGSGKTSVVKILSRLSGQKLNLITLSELSDTSELLGSFEQTKVANNREEEHFKFEWVDSVLVKSVQNGYWLLIDNANLCPASVLDRLNGLFEHEGQLVINEQGGERIIETHPNFRYVTVNSA